MGPHEFELWGALKNPLGQQKVWSSVEQVLLDGRVGSEDLEGDSMCEGLDKDLSSFIEKEGDPNLLLRMVFPSALKAHCAGQWNEGKQRSPVFFIKRLRAKLNLQGSLYPRSLCCGLLAMHMIKLDVDAPSDTLVPLVHQLVEHYLEGKKGKPFSHLASAFVEGMVALTGYSVEEFKDGTALKKHEKREEEELKRMLGDRY